MKTTLVILFLPLAAWADVGQTGLDAPRRDGVAPPDFMPADSAPRVDRPVLDAAPPSECTRLGLEGPGEYCTERSWDKDDVLGCRKDPANQAPAWCSNATDSRKLCCNGWQNAGWNDICRTSSIVLWCRKRQPGDPENPNWPEGCALGGAAGGNLAGALVPVLVLFAFARLRPRRRGRRSIAAGIVPLLLLASAARADVSSPPPPPDCSRLNFEGPEEYCLERPTGASDYFGCQRDPVNPPPDPAALIQCSDHRGWTRELCCAGWLAAGWRFDCVTGFSGSYALWCRKRLPGDPPRPEWPGSGGCAVGRSAVVGSAAGTLILVLFAAAGLFRRRR